MKSTGCSSIKLGFGSQHSQWLTTPVSGDLPGIFWPSCRQNINIHKISISFLFQIHFMHAEVFPCVYVCVSYECNAYTGQKALDALKLVIEAVCRMQVLGTDPYPSGSAVSALNLCATLQPCIFLVRILASKSSKLYSFQKT